MKFPDHLEGKIKTLLAVPIIFSVIYWISKEPKFSCDSYAGNFKNNYECHLVLTKIETGSGSITFYGTDLKTKLPISVTDYSKHINDNIENFKIGDTVIKNKGQYTITIKRGDKKILVPFICDREYPDTLATH